MVLGGVMNQKLTLSIDSSAIARGKDYAKRNGRSLSSMVESFLLLLNEDDNDIREQIPVSSKLMSLVGIGEGDITEDDYKRYKIERNNA